MDTIFVIDSHAERRAEICRVLLQGKQHAEPFDTLEEFSSYGNSEGLALIHDQDGATVRLCERLRSNPVPVPVIGYDENPPIESVVLAMQAGAVSYLAWPFTLERFGEEIAQVEPLILQGMARERRAARARALLTGLTGREREVLVCLISHGTNKAIAQQLDISPRTVEKYRAAILVRLGVANSAQAIRVAVEGGALDDSDLFDGSGHDAAGRRAEPIG